MRYCIAGSINMDFVVRTPRFPVPGETLTGTSFSTFPGGKGANQAMALAKLGAQVSFLGNVGQDIFGETYLSLFQKNGIETHGVGAVEGSTGSAIIEVEDSSAQNHIIIVPGANHSITPEVVESRRDVIQSSDALLLQLEIPMDSVLCAARIMKESGGLVILDPAPARELPSELYTLVDWMTPNESEAAILTGMDCQSKDGAQAAAAKIHSHGVSHVVIKNGKHGAYYAHGTDFFFSPSFPVNAVDTTAAGDSFNAGLAFALGLKKDAKEALRWANGVGGLATTAFGAQEAMPSYAQLQDLLSQHSTVH
ncbi:MAG: ribokinase [Spirochaetales bacterium]|nr:ribokinase [Spirochaetales bacterium]